MPVVFGIGLECVPEERIMNGISGWHVQFSLYIAEGTP
jgi:hypothetical protein